MCVECKNNMNFRIFFRWESNLKTVFKTGVDSCYVILSHDTSNSLFSWRIGAVANDWLNPLASQMKKIHLLQVF